MTGYCVMGEHAHCPDTLEDNSVCDCPCHITRGCSCGEADYVAPGHDGSTDSKVIERILTVTVTEHSWTTYRVPVSPDFNASDVLALEDVIANADDDELEIVDGRVEHREITVENDVTPQPTPGHDTDRSIATTGGEMFYELPARYLQKGVSTDDGQDVLEVCVDDGTVLVTMYSPRSEDATADAENRCAPETRVYGNEELVSLAVFADTRTDLSTHPHATGHRRLINGTWTPPTTDARATAVTDNDDEDEDEDAWFDSDVCRDPLDEGCRESLADGEGWDGCCGNCADRLEAEGHWS